MTLGHTENRISVVLIISESNCSSWTQWHLVIVLSRNVLNIQMWRWWHRCCVCFHWQENSIAKPLYLRPKQANQNLIRTDGFERSDKLKENLHSKMRTRRCIFKKEERALVLNVYSLFSSEEIETGKPIGWWWDPWGSILVMATPALRETGGEDAIKLWMIKA